MQVDVHGSAEHPFAKCCSKGALQGAEASAATSLLGKAGRAGHLEGGCLREMATTRANLPLGWRAEYITMVPLPQRVSRVETSHPKDCEGPSSAALTWSLNDAMAQV